MTVLTETPPVELPVVASPPVTRERTVADVLLDAAAYIEEYGWFQLGSYRCYDGPEPACAMVAIAFVTDDYRADDHVGSKALCHLETVIGGSVPRWNDAPGRTKQEVVAAFRKAAAES